MPGHDLTPELAAGFAHIALGHVAREYPNRLDHVLAAGEDAASPRTLHPVFFGSYDWHSCVHGHWLLARLRRRFPNAAFAERIAVHFDETFTADNIAGELTYLARPHAGTFERPYGWAWLLLLAAELHRDDGRDARRWSEILSPLADAFADRLKAFLPRADYPVRSGDHGNTAFALLLAAVYAEVAGDTALEGLVRAKAQAWYGKDRAAQAWEPSGEDFLSPTLCEAQLMRQVLGFDGFRQWLTHFLPDLGDGVPATLFEPVRVSDRGDARLVHLDGLNLSRAWAWRSLSPALDAPSAERAALAIRRHLAASLAEVTGAYVGAHWLASFALLALDGA